MPHARSKLPTAAETNAGLAAISTTVKAKYAVVGGAGCVALGHTRQTEDIDIVVPQGKTKDARTDLKGSESFTVEARTNHTAYVGQNKSLEPIDVEILTPPALFKLPYTGADNEVVVVKGVRVLHPRIILEAKTGSILGRSSDQKRKTDAADIIFLVNYLHSHHETLTVGQYGLTAEFIQSFVTNFPNAKPIFQAAGLYQSTGGTPSGSRPGTPTGSRPGTPTGRTTTTTGSRSNSPSRRV